MRTGVSQSMVRPHVCMGELFRRSPSLYLMCAHAAHQHPHMRLHACACLPKCFNATGRSYMLRVRLCAGICTHTYTRHTLTCIHACARGYVCVCVRAYTRRTRILRRTRMAQTWQQRMPHLTQHATRIIRMSGPYIIESRMQRRRAAKSTPLRTLVPLALRLRAGHSDN